MLLLSAVEDFDLKTINGRLLQVVSRNNHTYVNGTKVLKNDVMTLNGVIHTTNKVLVPQSKRLHTQEFITFFVC